MTDLVPTPPAGLDRPGDTVPGTADRIRAGVPENTRRSYARVEAQFTAWCADNGHQAVPASRATMADYAAHLCDQGRAPTTIEHDLGAVASLHRLAGHAKGQPDMTAANLVLRGYRRDATKAGRTSREAPPITRDRLRQMSAACDRDTPAGRRDRLLLVLGWALAGRRSELAGIHVEDITLDDGGMDIRIRTSKTDKQSEGVVVWVPAGEHVDTDPVTLLQDWQEVLAEQGVTSGPLFRGVHRGGRLYQHDGLSAWSVNEIVRRCAHAAGLPNWQTYTAHSLRAGFATQAAVDNIPQGVWAKHGRWNPLSPVPRKYERAATRKDNPLSRMQL